MDIIFSFFAMDTQSAQATSQHSFDPATLLRSIGVSQGMIVADCGCGPEAPFAFAAANIVGPHGMVYGLDVVQSALARVSEAARRQHIDVIQTIWTDLEMYGAARAVRSGSIDVAVLGNTLFQSQDHAGMFTEIARMLKHGGTLLVVDWDPNAQSGVGPEKMQRTMPDLVKKYAEAAGLQFRASVDVDADHWGMTFSRP